MLNSLAILSCRTWIEKREKLRGGGYYCRIYGENRIAQNKAAGWEIQKAAASTKSFSVVFCRVHSNSRDRTIQTDRRASGQLSGEVHTTVQDHELYGLLSQYMISL